MKHILAAAAVALLAACNTLPTAKQARAPAARPAPAYVPSGQPVFFEWDKADITPQAAATIKAAADKVKAGQNARVNITGYTDASGTRPYNQDLALRRAEAVREELLRNGVEPQNIGSTVGKGETPQMVRTRDGVANPQNRRAEIAVVR